MGSISANTIITDVAFDLHDAAHSHWTEAELLDYLNEAQRAICYKLPRAYTVDVGITIISSGHRHTLPTDVTSLLGVRRSDGTNIQLVDIPTLDSEDPEWATITPSTSIDEYGYDPVLNPRYYYTIPPAQNGTTLTLQCAKVPPILVSVGSNIVIQDVYEPAIKAFMLFKAHNKEGEGQSTEKAQGYYQEFINLIGS